MKNSRKGFTLFEMVIYVALLSIVTGSTLFIANNLLRSAGITDEKIIIEEEANFILRKIEWALTGFDSILTPAPGSSATNIVINKPNYATNPIAFDLNAGNIRISKQSGSFSEINTERVTIDSLSFEHIATLGDAPEGIKTNITISGRSYELLIYDKK